MAFKKKLVVMVWVILALSNFFLFGVFLGIQRDSGVLLGTIPGGVELRHPRRSGPEEENTEGGFRGQACQALDRGGHPRIQHLRLVDERPPDQLSVTIYIPSLTVYNVFYVSMCPLNCSMTQFGPY